MDVPNENEGITVLLSLLTSFTGAPVSSFFRMEFDPVLHCAWGDSIRRDAVLMFTV